MDFINAALPAVFIIVGIALIWFVVELAITVRKARGTIDELKADIDPLIERANSIVEAVQPAIEKVDPLVGKVNLTVDAANLEIMRVDQILEDVTQITDTLSTATTTVDKVAQAPVSAVENVSKRIRDAFRPRKASTVSRALGDQKEADAAAETEVPTAPAAERPAAPEQPVAGEVSQSEGVAAPSADPAPAEADGDDSPIEHAAHAANTDE